MDEIDSIQNYCRICASNSPDIRNLFEVVYQEKLLSDILGQCLQCTIYRTEYFPENICSECCADLIEMQKFIAIYEKSEKWFISRYNAMNEGKLIKTETVCAMDLEQIPEISVEPRRPIYSESLANTVPVQDPPRNPLELKEELDHDYEFGMDESPASPNGSHLETSELNEATSYEPDILVAEYSNVINKDTVRKATQNSEMIRHQTEPRRNECSICFKRFINPDYLSKHENLHTATKSYQCYFCDTKLLRSDYRVNHIRKMHPEIVFECFICKITFNTYFNLCRHMLDDSHDTSSGNNKREMSFTMKDRLMDHQITHSDEKNFKCTHQDCQKAFKRRIGLLEHLKIHEGKIDYFCECGQGFVLARQLRRHQVIHEREQQKIVPSHRCSVCSKVFTRRKSLKLHMDRHKGKMYQCKYCDLQLTTYSGREKHQRNIHVAPKSYECFVCKRVFKYRLDLCRHMEVHSSNGRVTFECEICSKPFWAEHAFIDHKRKHSAQVFDCEYCDESFEKKFDVKFHVLEMHIDKLDQYKCDRCSKRFSLKSTLKSHIYKMHTFGKQEKRESHLCTECGRTFSTNYLLKLHLQNHSDEKPFACNQCPSKFKRKVLLQSHMRVHSSERYFICEVVVDGGQICGQKLRTPTGLRKHKINHSITRDKPFQCQSCPANFFRNYDLQIHTRIHTGERPFRCEHCDRAFTQKGDMTKHMLIHLGPTPHKCTECGESFRLETELRKHSYSHFKPPEN